MELISSRTSMRASLLMAALTLAGCAGTPEVVKPDPVAQVAPPPKERTAQERFAEAIAAFDKGDYDAAAEGFRKVLDKTPTMVNAQYNLGVIAEYKGELAKAQAAY